MKKLINLFILLLVSSSAHAQTTMPGLARVGGKGIFVLCGDKISSENGPVTAYRIERKGGGDKDFKTVATLAAVKAIGDFKAGFNSAADMVPYKIDLSMYRIDSVWKKGKASGLISKMSALGASLPVLAGFNMIWLDKEVVAGTTYEYRVTAIGTNETSLSLPVTMGKPAVTSGLTYNAAYYEVPAKSVFLKYGSKGARRPSALEVYRCELDRNEFLKVPVMITQRASKDSTLFTIKDSTVKRFGIYRYYVKGWDALGNEAPKSDTQQVAALDYVQMPMVQYVSATPDSSARNIVINWKLSDMPVIKMIRLFRSTNSVNGFQPIATISLDQRSYIDEAIVPATPYFYYFELTYKTSDRPKQSTLFSANAMSKEMPGMIEALETDKTADGVHLKWRYYETATGGFRIYRGRENGDMQLMAATVSAIDSIHNYDFTDTDTSLIGGNFYRYAIQAISTSHVVGMFSDTVSVFIPKQKNVRPIPPMALEGHYADDQVHLSWQDRKAADDDIIGYTILRKHNGRTDTLYTGLNHYADTVTAAGDSYVYSVLSNASGGIQSAPSSSVTVRVSAALSAPPARLFAKSTPKGVELKWALPDDKTVAQYHIYRTTAGGEPVKIAALSNTATSYIDTTTVTGNQYFYSITTINSKGTESEPGKEAGVYR